MMTKDVILNGAKRNEESFGNLKILRIRSG